MVSLLSSFGKVDLNPSNPGPPVNPPVGGLNQMSSDNLKNMGLTRSQWLSMTVAQQVAWIFAWWDGLSIGIPYPADAAAIYALNFLPARYKSRATNNRDAPLTSAGENYYDKNSSLDPDHTGSITVNTIARKLSGIMASTNSRWKMIQNGIANAGAVITPDTPSSVTTDSFATNFFKAIVITTGGVVVLMAGQKLIQQYQIQSRYRRRYA